MIAFSKENIEEVMKLMRKYKITEYASEHFSLKTEFPAKQTRKKAIINIKDVAEPTSQEFLDNYTVPQLPEEPWNQIPQSAIDNWSATGKLKD